MGRDGLGYLVAWLFVGGLWAYPILVKPALAGAVSRSVRDACRQDYYDYCNGLAIGSATLRQCMRKNQRRLSAGCASALVNAGEAPSASHGRAMGRTTRAR